MSLLLSENKQLQVEVSDDGTSARLSVNPNVGMEGMEAEAILAALAQLKIAVSNEAAGSITTFAAQMATGKAPAPVLVAEGRSPVNDKPGQVKMLVSAPAAEARSDDGDTVNFYDQTRYIMVSQGQPILEVIPAQDGQDGTDIYGRPIAHQRSKSLAIKLGANVAWTDDQRTLLAKAAGHMVRNGDKISVETVLRIQDNVDFSTGNIDFPGEVIVGKNVVDLFSVKSDLSITVGGMVESAQVDAGTDLLVTGGIAGKEKGHARAGQHVVTKFVTNAHLEAGGNVTSQNEVINSRVICDGTLTVENGPLEGGHVTATTGVRAKIIGSEGDVKTIVEVGSNDPLRQQVLKQAPEIASKRERAAEIKKVVDPLLRNQKSLNAQQKERATELLFEAQELESDAEEMLDDLRKKLEDVRALTPIIEIDTLLHPGVSIRFPRAEAKIAEAYKGPLQIKLREAEGKPRTIVLIDLKTQSMVELRTHRTRDDALNALTTLLADEE